MFSHFLLAFFLLIFFHLLSKVTNVFPSSCFYTSRLIGVPPVALLGKSGSRSIDELVSSMSSFFLSNVSNSSVCQCETKFLQYDLYYYVSIHHYYVQPAETQAQLSTRAFRIRVG